jgi:2-methylisocitrate lyase-like PEP mutase family enzyme
MSGSTQERDLVHLSASGCCGPTRFTPTKLKEFGVRRVTIGTSLFRAGLTAVVGAAREVLHEGSFNYLDGIYAVADFNELIDPLQPITDTSR